jgi:hypothetical protein
MVVEIKDTQSEIIKLITNLKQEKPEEAEEIYRREKRERSKERIQETLKNLEARLDNFA